MAVDLPLDPERRGLQQGAIDQAAAPCPVPPAQRRQGAYGDEQPARLVVDRGTGEGRRAVGLAGHAHHAAKSLQQRVEAGLHHHRPLKAEGPDRAVDQPRVALQHAGRADATLLDHARAEVLDQYVGRLAKPVERRHVLRALQVQGDRALRAILAVEVERGDAVRAIGRAPEPRIVAAIRLFHLDDVGAHVGQHRTRERAGERLANLDDGQPGEWQVHARILRRQHSGWGGRVDAALM